MTNKPSGPLCKCAAYRLGGGCQQLALTADSSCRPAPAKVRRLRASTLARQTSHHRPFRPLFFPQTPEDAGIGCANPTTQKTGMACTPRCRQLQQASRY